MHLFFMLSFPFFSKSSIELYQFIIKFARKFKSLTIVPCFVLGFIYLKLPGVWYFNPSYEKWNTVMIPIFQTDRSGQTV